MTCCYDWPAAMLTFCTARRQMRQLPLLLSAAQSHFQTVRNVCSKVNLAHSNIVASLTRQIFLFPMGSLCASLPRKSPAGAPSGHFLQSQCCSQYREFSHVINALHQNKYGWHVDMQSRIDDIAVRNRMTQGMGGQ